MNWGIGKDSPKISFWPPPNNEDLFTAIKVVIGVCLCVGVWFGHFWSTFHEEIKRKKLFPHISVVVLLISCGVCSPVAIVVCSGSSLKPELSFNFLSYYFAYKSVHNPWTTLSLNSSASTQWNSHPGFNLLSPWYILSSLFMAWHTRWI